MLIFNFNLAVLLGYSHLTSILCRRALHRRRLAELLALVVYRKPLSVEDAHKDFLLVFGQRKTQFDFVYAQLVECGDVRVGVVSVGLLLQLNYVPVNEALHNSVSVVQDRVEVLDMLQNF